MGLFDSYWTEDTLSSLLARQALARPHAVAISSGRETITYARLAASVDAKARGLAGLGIGAGDVVSVQLPNGPEFLIAYLAVARLGAVLSTIHMPYRVREAVDLMRAARSKAFIGLTRWHGQSPVEEVLGVAASIPSVRAFIAVGEGAPPAALAWDRVGDAIGDAVGDAEDGPLPDPPSAGQPFLLLW